MLRVLCAFFALSVVKNGRKTPLLKYRYLIPLQKTNFAAVRKYVLCLCFLLVALTVMGQKKSVVVLIKSESSTGVKLNGKDMIKVYQGTFKQDYSTLTSDSAYFYPDENAFDAFGHVIIDQGDTLHIYSDLLNYNGNTKVAILTNNVKMVDKDATLTTNHFTYNTATRIGIYTDGGKLINKDNTLLSKNGYYFAKTRDSYFRYNVSLTTPDALVLTDTMRYNTGTRISYFYGPTNIYGTKGKKDQDTLYTENGQYNTKVEQGAFGKNNLYHSGTKSLKGDSLFYDKLKGYGRAVMHVTFEDKEQKTVIKGNLGTYFKDDEHTIVTEDPYVIMVTEQQRDSTQTDSIKKADSLAKADSLSKKQPLKKGAITMDQLIKKTIPGKTDSLSNAQKNDLLKAVLTNKDTISTAQKNAAMKLLAANGVKKDSVVAQARALMKTPQAQQALAKAQATAAKKLKNTPPVKTLDTTKNKTVEKPGLKDTSKSKVDTIWMSADTIETRVMPYKDLKVYLEQQRLIHMMDTAKKKKVKKTPVVESKFLTAYQAGLPPDTSYLQRNLFGHAKPKVVKKKPPSKKQLLLDSLEKKRVADSVLLAKRAEPPDTAHIRILIGYHHFKLFKSDLQAKSDSMFYSSSDSTIRCFVNPMMWTEGSQLSGDTILLQMKNRKLNNMRMFPHAFIVNVEKDDSTHFNQVGGKRMRGYFKNNKLYHMIIEGNAESIYFSRDSAKKTVDGMQRSLSSSIGAYFKDNKVTNMAFYTKPENKYGPLKKFTKDDQVLKAFIWKPKDRPVSKESIIPSYNKKKKADDDKKALAAKGAPDKNKKGKSTAQPPLGTKTAGKDSISGKTPGGTLPLKTGKDSLKIDTGKKPIPLPVKDTTKVKAPPVKTGN
jgi:lipopolysaccharide export system protein LptA